MFFLQNQSLILMFLFPCQSADVQLNLTFIRPLEYTWSCSHKSWYRIRPQIFKSNEIYTSWLEVVDIDYRYYCQICCTNRKEGQIVEPILKMMRIHYASLLTNNYHKWQVLNGYSWTKWYHLSSNPFLSWYLRIMMHSS